MTQRRLALLPTGPVGLAVAETLGAAGVRLACLVLDAARPEERQALLSALRVEPEVVLEHTDLTATDGLERFGSCQVDLGLLAWWPYLLRAPAIALARAGFLNFHPSLLPFGRGKDPNFWALREGTPYGVTIHFVDEGVDSGPIAFQRELPVTWEDDGGSLYRRALTEIVQLFREHLPTILSGEIPRQPQPAAAPTPTHRRAELEPASSIDLAARTTAADLLNLLRARTFDGHPAARFRDGPVEYEVRVQIRRVKRS